VELVFLIQAWPPSTLCTVHPDGGKVGSEKLSFSGAANKPPITKVVKSSNNNFFITYLLEEV
jgi:hypothetical protein